MVEGGIQGSDKSVTSRRYTVPEAAEALGLTVEAIRGRIKRNTIEHERTPDGVFVLLTDDQPSTTQQPVDDKSDDKSELVATLKEQIEYLREQLDQERQARTEERRRHDTIIAQLTSRIPELEPARETPPEASESPSVAAEPPGKSTGGQDRENQTSSPEPERRSWWQRWFGSEQ